MSARAPQDTSPVRACMRLAGLHEGPYLLVNGPRFQRSRMQNPVRQRLRFVDMTSTPLADGTRRVVVEVEWMGASHRGEAMGTGTLEGDLRATGEATVAAARAAT